MVSKVVVGYLCAIASTILSGSWQAAVKSSSISRHQLHPAVLNVQFMFGFFVMSWVALFDAHNFTFTWWGVLSAALFDASMSLNIAVSFPVLGIAVGSGIASSIAIITSLVWSALILDQSMRSIGMTCLGVGVVILGVNLIIFTGRYFTVPVKVCKINDKLKKKKDDDDDGGNDGERSESSPLIQHNRDSSINNNDEDESDVNLESNLTIKKELDELMVDKKRFMVGVIGAFCAGIFGGSYLVPNMSCCADDDTMFLPSLGIGCVLVGPLFSIIIVFVTRLLDPAPSSSSSAAAAASSAVEAAVVCPPMDVLLETTPWGMLPGSVVALAVILIVKAMDDLDYVVANTITQCSIFVTGLWGWILFKEFDEKTWGVVCFFASAVILVGGATIVAYWGTTK